MTQLQLDYLRHAEQSRHNLVTEDQNQRALDEQSRHNAATESVAQGQLWVSKMMADEAKRSHLAEEAIKKGQWEDMAAQRSANVALTYAQLGNTYAQTDLTKEKAALAKIEKKTKVIDTLSNLARIATIGFSIAAAPATGGASLLALPLAALPPGK